ncbi:MAG: HNH endonuclease [Kiritimatiellae bacterium]|nr:HNH endonuclease [Kiritimatiellia bacterium]
MAEKNYICERCGAPAVICHHREYLNERNALDKHNLEALCFRCHNEEHFSHAVKFNEAGDPLPPRRG